MKVMAELTGNSNSAWSPSAAFWRYRPVAVTGATGFLGSHLTQLLVELGASVVVLRRDHVVPTSVGRHWADKVAYVDGDIGDQAVLERMLGEYEVRSVFHLAAQSQVPTSNLNPVSTFEANVAGTWALMEAVRRSPLVEQVVTASSDKAYGSQPVLPYDESMPLSAINPYDVSKACSDLIAQSYQATWNVPVAITRCGNFFGPGDQNYLRLLPGTIRSVLAGERPVIRSDGTQIRDYLYVVDGALAYLCLAEAMATDPTHIGEAYNFSTERPLSVLELVALIQEAAGTELEPDIQATARAEIAEQHLSAKKAKERLGWTPRYTIEEAMAETVEWYRAELGY